MLGMGDLTRVNLIGEKSGLVPTKGWKLRARGEEWLAGETISASIGQGFNLVTPIQQARLVATVANGGMILKPYLVRKVKDKDGRVVKETFPSIEKRLESRPDTLSIIQKGLFGVVNEKRGTGWRARLKQIKVAGKTGTAQVVRLKLAPGSEKDETPYKHRDHAWFVGYAPYENPEIAVAVIVEHGGHGGSAAAPIVRQIVEAYNKYYPQNPSEEENRETPDSGT
jgi:penicillin-binding protein 2